MLEVLKSLNILLVEDEPEIQKYFKETFEYFFKTVYTASHGNEAIELYEKENISMIFTDYSMPIMNGYELVVQIRKVNKTIPIVVISNYDDREKLQKCITLGLSGYLFKPMDYKDIKKFLVDFSDDLIKNNKLEYTISNNCTLNLSTITINIDNNNYSLTDLEFSFLSLMVSYANKVVSYDLIFENLFKYELTINSIKNLVYRLKSKYKFDKIKNIINIGYILVTDEK